MTRKFSHRIPSVGAPLPPNAFGRLSAEFQFASHIPLKGGHDTGRHIYLALKVPSGPFAGVYEAAVNIRSDEGTEVKYADRLEDLGGDLPDLGFQAGVKLAYGNGPDASDPDFMGLKDEDFTDIVNDELYNKIADLSQGCDRVAVYGVTYSSKDGIHDAHMNSGTRADDTLHARDDRVREDGAIAFYFNLEAGGQKKAFAHWVFIKFDSQSVVNYSE